MGQDTKIEWTDATWNPLRGCSKVSPGCENCYAIRTAARFNGQGQPYEGLAKRSPLNWTGDVREVPDHLDDPLRWKRPRRIFVNSMSDLFHEKVSDDFIAAVFGVMAAAPQHTFQILTKRADRMADWFQWATRRGLQGASMFPDDPLEWRIRQMCNVAARKAGVDMNADTRQNHGGPWPLPNVWLGVSCEDQQRADARIPHLLNTPAAVRFLSCEPLLGPIDFRKVPGFNLAGARGLDLLRNLWVIAGGESGHRARPMHPDWARSLRDLCQTGGVPFFFKQWGEWAPVPTNSGDREGRISMLADGRIVSRALSADKGFATVDSTAFREKPWEREDFRWLERVGKHAAGRLLDGRTWDEFPSV